MAEETELRFATFHTLQGLRSLPMKGFLAGASSARRPRSRGGFCRPHRETTRRRIISDGERKLAILVRTVGRSPSGYCLPNLRSERQTLAHVELRVNLGVESRRPGSVRRG